MSVIISILISILLSLFVVLAAYNTRTVLAHQTHTQLKQSLESGFAIAQSAYYSQPNGTTWEQMPYNNDSVQVGSEAWGCFLLIDVKAKNAHFRLNKTGLFGTHAWRDTALFITEQNRQVGLAGKIRFNGPAYLPKAGVKPAYIEGTGFSDLNVVRPYLRAAPDHLPLLDEHYLSTVSQSQSGINPYRDSLLSFIPDQWNQPFNRQSAVVQQGNIHLVNQALSNHIKLIASDVIIVENTAELNQVLLIARKVVFRKGFKGIVHVICSDTVMTEDECEFGYPSSFCVYSDQVPDSARGQVRGIFFGTDCKFAGGLLAANDSKERSRLMIRLNKHFELIGNLYSSDYADVQGLLYGSVCCRTLLLQTPSGIYENHLYNCVIDPRRYSQAMAVPAWMKQGEKQLRCAQWF